MVRLWLDPPDARLEFDRADWGFPERDCLFLDLLCRTCANCSAMRRVVAPSRRVYCRMFDSARARDSRPRGGMANAEVAKILWISPGTVRKHLENAHEKLGVHTRTAAVAAAIK